MRFVETNLMDEYTQIRVNTRFANRLRGRGWFRNFSEFQLIKFGTLTRVLAGYARHTRNVEVHHEETPNWVCLKSIQDWTCRGTVREAIYIQVTLCFRRDIETGLKISQFEVKELVDN